ncbi:MAG TPA: hypothetical protein VL485_09865 [Ktedonobacteraceae bacterium]|nr:hypothetical protein [Ktedonobacteraceae bacterium]
MLTEEGAAVRSLMMSMRAATQTGITALEPLAYPPACIPNDSPTPTH